MMAACPTMTTASAVSSVLMKVVFLCPSGWGSSRNRGHPARKRASRFHGMKNVIAKSADGSTWAPGKISEMILEFAQPLLEADGGPPNIQAARNIMRLVMICWNLPVLEAEGRHEDVQMRKMFDEAIDRMPARLKGLLLGLVTDRKTKFESIPFLVNLRIEGSNLEDARLVAEARMPLPGHTAPQPRC